MKKVFLNFVLFLLTGISAASGAEKGQGLVYPAKNISVSIHRSVQDVYAFVADPLNLPKWAAGLSQSKVSKVGEDWIADSPMGKVKVKFAAKNNLGVLDHDVTLPSGEVNHNPLRVAKNGNGSEIIFTVYRLPKVTDEQFQSDTALVRKDLEKLKSILEP